MKLKAFQEHELEAVNEAAERYTRELRDYVKTPFICQGYYSSWAQYSILVKDEEYRNRLQIYLREKGIPSMIYYPKPMSRQTAFEGIGCKKIELPIAEKLCQSVLSLPLHPYMEKYEQNIVINEIQKFCKA